MKRKYNDHEESDSRDMSQVGLKTIAMSMKAQIDHDEYKTRQWLWRKLLRGRVGMVDVIYTVHLQGKQRPWRQQNKNTVKE